VILFYAAEPALSGCCAAVILFCAAEPPLSGCCAAVILFYAAEPALSGCCAAVLFFCAAEPVLLDYCAAVYLFSMRRSPTFRTTASLGSFSFSAKLSLPSYNYKFDMVLTVALRPFFQN
jgi:hypothetical protein